MKDLNKQPSEMTEVERWERFDELLAEALVEAWESGRLTTATYASEITACAA